MKLSREEIDRLAALPPDHPELIDALERVKASGDPEQLEAFAAALRKVVDAYLHRLTLFKRELEQRGN